MFLLMARSTCVMLGTRKMSLLGRVMSILAVSYVGSLPGILEWPGIQVNIISLPMAWCLVASIRMLVTRSTWSGSHGCCSACNADLGSVAMKARVGLVERGWWSAPLMATRSVCVEEGPSVKRHWVVTPSLTIAALATPVGWSTGPSVYRPWLRGLRLVALDGLMPSL